MGRTLTTNLQLSVNTPSTATATYTANFRDQYNITFVNNVVGLGNVGTLRINGQVTNMPTSVFYVRKNDQITAEGTMFVINGIEYLIDHWQDGSSAYFRAFYPTNHTTYTVYYVGIPDATPMNTTLNYNETGQPVRLSWTEHPNSNVMQYRVYRGAKVEGNFTNPVVIATLNRGTTSYTDYGYVVGGSNSNSVAYDVVPYYATEQTWGVIGMHIISATQDLPQPTVNENILSQTIASELSTEYSISNYPNPFNPATTINYQLPENSFVTIKVYDTLGKEIATLVNESKSAGYHKVTFDASRLTSGIYIYTISANNFIQSKKILLMK